MGNSLCMNTVLKWGQSAMPQTCENLLGPVNSYVCYDNHAREIYQVLPYSVDFKAPRELWNPLSKTVLSKVDVVLYRIKDLYTCDMGVKLENNLYVGPENNFHNFCTVIKHLREKNAHYHPHIALHKSPFLTPLTTVISDLVLVQHMHLQHRNSRNLDPENRQRVSFMTIIVYKQLLLFLHFLIQPGPLNMTLHSRLSAKCF